VEWSYIRYSFNYTERPQAIRVRDSCEGAFVIDGSVEVRGLKNAIKAMNSAFPKNPKQKMRLLNSAMGAAAAPTILATAKQLAMQGDGSGALSESLGIRSTGLRKTLKRGKAASVEIVPIRDNKKAMRMYVDYYYTKRGKIPHIGILNSGIRHGHLVEWGFRHVSGVDVPARSFLRAAVQARYKGYKSRFAKNLRKKTEAAVRRARRRVSG
jgi:hypothetical protein